MRQVPSAGNPPSLTLADNLLWLLAITKSERRVFDLRDLVDIDPSSLYLRITAYHCVRDCMRDQITGCYIAAPAGAS
jgi:hypothetical protein